MTDNEYRLELFVLTIKIFLWGYLLKFPFANYLFVFSMTKNMCHASALPRGSKIHFIFLLQHTCMFGFSLIIFPQVFLFSCMSASNFVIKLFREEEQMEFDHILLVGLMKLGC